MRSLLDTLTYIVLLGALTSIITKLKPVKIALMKRAAAYCERKFADMQQAGHKKKALAFRILRWIFIPLDNASSDTMDAIIAAANVKNAEMTETLKADAAAKTLAMVASIKKVTLKDISAQLAALKK